MSNHHFDIIIVGAGASGLMAAVRASDQNLDVLILEHQPKAGIKILSTGNGRCNLTNSDLSSAHFRCEDSMFSRPALDAFSRQDTIRFFEERLHLFCKEKNGYWYPRSNQATAVREALLAGCQENGVKIRRNEQIQDIRKENERFHIRTDKDTYSAAVCILCCGGKAFPKSGSDGSGYRLAKAFGHSIVKPLPALMALYSDRSELFVLAGVRAWGKVSLFVNGTHVITDEGELQFTDYGISGIPVFQISRYVLESDGGGNSREQAAPELLGDYLNRLSKDQRYWIEEMKRLRDADSGTEPCTHLQMPDNNPDNRYMRL